MTSPGGAVYRTGHPVLCRISRPAWQLGPFSSARRVSVWLHVIRTVNKLGRAFAILDLPCGCGATNRAGRGAELVWRTDAAPGTGLTLRLMLEGGGGYGRPLTPSGLVVGIRAEAGDRRSDSLGR